ncbi:erythromycin esterase family protein [Chitinophaga filiformis]|uniref:erythromycin esterase family protein n=1 Tax=Chitinophaga filiformis TaxID=104663 RepID=UPI001F47BC21|nr:erythromycin esterase family protein [Chitinophaga filiformis]MCF6405347.1 erythromycin esterase family protein [Chitinophaga filiformis]
MHLLTDMKSLDPLLKDIDERRIVMLGEASHGTHEYYTWRTAISKRLIQEKGFRFIAVEGDWPDCYRINRYVKGYEDAGADISSILQTFDRWPTWMWANWEVAALADWLKEYNRKLPLERRVGFYGLDVYSLWDSMSTIMHYLEKEDQQTAASVKKAIACFEPFNEDEHLYARSSLADHNCRDEVLNMLREVRLKAQFLDGDMEAGFNTEQNALIAVNAERYYRSMIGFSNESWNIRDGHMMETLERLLEFHGILSKGIIWEHNTHIGDARATDMTGAGMVNIGQLAREEYGKEHVYLAGFASYKGTVIAGSEWGAPMQKMVVPEARAESIEAVLHDEYGTNCYKLFSDKREEVFATRIGHRAIGVVYHPGAERRGNYVPSVLPERYDALIFLDETQALHPLHMKPHDQKMPETYPFGI